MKFKGLWKSAILTMAAFAFFLLAGNAVQAAEPIPAIDVENTGEAVAPASAPSSVTQTNAGETSITLKWSSVTGADGYRIYFPKSGAQPDKYIEIEGKTTYNFTKLSKNTLYDFYIYPYAKEGTAQAIGKGVLYRGVPTLPTKITGMKYYDYELSSRQQWFTYSARNSADGIQYQILNAKGTRIASAIVSPGPASASKDYITFKTSKIKTNQFYKVKMRGVVYVNNGNTKKYGKWSDAMWFGQGSKVKEVAPSGSGVKLKWEKMAGTKNYTVYISNKQRSGYKKAGTTTKTNIKINKYNKKALKNGQKYWIRVVANKKVGSKTIKSLSAYSWSFTYRKY